ncbi:RNA-directed DNA polymerase, eukaryota, reverse transcriptase zinc-binding domain protein [Tanacetum coccineum]
MAFILWMAVRRRLQTQDRVMAWYNNNDMKCPLCKGSNDSHNHLFFKCDYSRKFWVELKDKMENRDMSNSWDILVDQYAGNVCNNSIGSILIRIVLSAAVYNIRKERNARLFIGEVKDDVTVLKIIIQNVKLQLSSLKVKRSCNVDKVASKWNVKMNYKIVEGITLNDLLHGIHHMLLWGYGIMDHDHNSVFLLLALGRVCDSILGLFGLLTSQMYHKEGGTHCEGFDDTKVFKVVSRSMWKLGYDYEKKITLSDKGVELQRSFGWTEDEICTMTRSSPLCLRRSEGAIKAKLEWFKEEIGYGGEYLSTHPKLLVYSLEKRVIPRYKVLASLKEKNVLKSKLSFCTVVALSEEKFVRDFVLPYCEFVPSIYENYTKSTALTINY